MLQKIGDELDEKYSKEYSDANDGDTKYAFRFFQSDYWTTGRMAAIKSIKKGLFWSHQYIFSNYFLDGWSAEKIFNFYNKRGCMENLIKELKQDFFYDKTDSSTFLANYARNLISCISYNIIKLFQNKVLNQKNNKEITSAKSWMFSSIRNNLLKIGTRVIKHGRYIHFKLTNSNPFDKLFWLIFHRILA